MEQPCNTACDALRRRARYSFLPRRMLRLYPTSRPLCTTGAMGYLPTELLVCRVLAHPKRSGRSSACLIAINYSRHKAHKRAHKHAHIAVNVPDDEGRTGGARRAEPSGSVARWRTMGRGRVETGSGGMAMAQKTLQIRRLPLLGNACHRRCMWPPDDVRSERKRSISSCSGRVSPIHHQ